MKSLPAPVALLASILLTAPVAASEVCSYTIYSRSPGLNCPLRTGATACASMSAITGPCNVPIQCYGGTGFLCDVILKPKSGPQPRCPFSSRRLERTGNLRCARILVKTATPTITPTPINTPTRTSTPTVTIPFGCPDINATPTPGTPPPAPGDDSLTPGPCTDLESGIAGTAPGSVVVLPKVVADLTRDTLVELTNRSNIEAFVHCFYVNGTLTDPTQPPGPLNPPLLQTTDFQLHLTAQQPIQWTASGGRMSNPTAPADPGQIPPVIAPFLGELKCVQVDAADVPFAGNSLIAAATLLGPQGDVSKYDAITFIGTDNPNFDNVFALDDVEFSACPRELIFNINADGAADPVLGAGSSVSNRLTLVTCREDFLTQLFGTATVIAITTDEFELSLSASFTVDGYFDLDLPGISSAFTSFGESFRQLRVRSASTKRCVGGPGNGLLCSVDADCAAGGHCLPQSAVIGVLESTHTNAAGKSARAIQNAHTCGSNPAGAITLPMVP